MEWHHQFCHARKNSKCRFLWLKSWLASAGTVHLVSGILWGKCHNQFRVTCADIKEVKTMTAKSSAKQEGEGESSPPAWQYQTSEVNGTIGCTVLPWPPYSSNLAPSDFICFAPWRKQPQDAAFQWQLKHSVREELQCYSREFCESGIVCVTKCGRSVLIIKETGKIISTL